MNAAMRVDQADHDQQAEDELDEPGEPSTAQVPVGTGVPSGQPNSLIEPCSI